MKNKLFLIISFFVFSNSLKSQFSASNFTLISVIDPETYTNSYGAKYSGCWGWYQATKNKEYAIAGSASGTYWVDVTNPATPTVSAFKAGKKTTTVWREIKTYQNYCYVISDDGGPNSFQIFDMQYLPDSVHTVHDSQVIFKKGHTLWVDGNKLYVASVTYSDNSTSSMNVYSLATPSVPLLLRKLSQDAPFIGGVHDMYARNDTVFASCGYSGLYVFTLTPTNTFTPMGSLTTYSGSGYNHSSALTPNGQTLVFVDEVPTGKPIKVANVSNLSNMQVLAITNQYPQTTPHNPFMVSNSLCFMSSYQDGLQLYDISSPSTPTLVGYFDTYFQGGGNNNNWSGDPYDGQWGSYPYFPSKNIFALDQNNGIFMLKTHLFMNAPVPNFLAQSNICVGGTTTFSNTSMHSTSYTWSFAGGNPATSTLTSPTVNYNTTGNFSVTLTASNGFSSITTSSLINVYQVQTNVPTYTNTSCSSCNDGVASIVAVGGINPYTYIWLPNNANTAIVNNLLPGCYSVTISDANNCKASQTVCIGFSTSNNLINSNSNLLIYPNPAINKVTIDYYGVVFNYSCYDSFGRLISNSKNNRDKAIINLSDLTKGIYLIEVEAGKEKVRKKLIVE